jgi:hypothetical protein
MTVPAHVSATVRRKVDPGNLRRARCLGVMARPAYLTCCRLLGERHSGILPVVGRHDMTRHARDSGVPRNHLFAGYLSMTSAALFRRMRQYRVVRIVARYAGSARIVHFREYLRKTRRPRWVIAMAEWAVTPAARDCRLDGIRRVHMSLRRAMANFASQSLMIGLMLQFVNVGMAVDTGVRTCIRDIARRNLSRRIPPIMSIFTESLGDQDQPGNDQCGQTATGEDDEGYDLSRQLSLAQPVFFLLPNAKNPLC